MTTAAAACRTAAAPAGPVRADVLRATYARLGEALGSLVRLEPGPHAGDGPITGERLVRDAALRERLVDETIRRMADAHGVTPRRDVAATDVLHRYSFFATAAMSGPWFLERRVPWLGLREIGYDEAAFSLSVAPSRIACLPDDPAAGLPGMRAVADEERLRQELRNAVAQHIGPVLEAFRPLLRRGPRVLWGSATDELAEGIWYVGRVVGEEGRAVRAAEELLPGGTPPFAGSAGFRPCAGPDGEAARTRINCCLWYTVTPQDLCGTCPRRARS
ncbi:(2Fe-2S)-binding protein [Actinomadura macrotermitis]|uniref:Ferric siderophore reductase C-terminal domain-containing protein n=1 Tax=Actinomadura macrotermitis TaxID=2585200 RepID=A0A7K0BMR1_9ACTN|nr:(2Fe-2S)-binding protein [Actinomadura macrotermitis]MQY02162.1 hypothetical protein [Actinomadura macrotermitis]